MTRRPRLDELLVARGLFPNVHDAQAAVLAGSVVVGEHRETSAGKRVAEDVAIRLKAGKEKDRLGYASRGGGKLAAALDAFGIDPTGMSCADLGCSTGGFTDCLLQHGAAHVSSIDVGRADFDWRLRNDERVSLFERTNVRGIDATAVGAPFDLVVADLSFIRLESVLADVVRLLGPAGRFVSLVKPQFEADREQVLEGGVVRDAAVHEQVLARVCAACAQHGLVVSGLTFSPVQGPKGNVEFLLLSAFDSASAADGMAFDAEEIRRVVRASHDALGG